MLFNTSDPEAMNTSGKRAMEQDKDIGMTQRGTGVNKVQEAETENETGSECFWENLLLT